MTAPPLRAAYLAHLQQLYGLGLKERENDCATYDHYLGVMQPGLSLRGTVDAVLEAQPRARLLDIGCGDAGALREVVAAYGDRVDAHGCDLVVSPDTAPVHVQGGDAARLAFPADCDLVVSFRALHEIGQLETLVPKVARALARGGVAYLSVRIAEFAEGRVEPQGSITPRDVQWIRTTAAMGLVAGARLRAVEVTGVATVSLPLEPGAAPTEQEFGYLRGVNLFLARAL